jgi:hypothetical protein
MKTAADRNVHCTFKGTEPLGERGKTPRERERTRNNKSMLSGTFTSTSTFTFQGPQLNS